MSVARQHETPRWRSALDSIDLLDVVAVAFFVVAIIAIWTKTHPFMDQRVQVLTNVAQSSESRKFIMIVIAAVALLLVLLRRQFRTIVRFPGVLLVIVFAWFGFAGLHSISPKLAFDHLALTAVVIATAASLPLMFRSLQAFVDAYGTAVLLTIVLSFAGVVLVPELSIHSAVDHSEQTLAGAWRGIFAHKNDLSPMMNQFLFVGVLLLRMKKLLWGSAIVVGATVLLVMSGGKSAALTLPLTFIGSWAIVRARSFPATVIIAVALVAGLAALTLGSVAMPFTRQIAQAVLPDPTFTGRTDIWVMALQAIGKAPIFGYGYTTFFDTDLLKEFTTAHGMTFLPDNAHNGYVEMALSGGLIGLGLVLAWVVIVPLKYILALKGRLRTADERYFLSFTVQSWLSMLLISSLKSALFDRGEPLWFGGLLAIVCLRYWYVSGGPAEERREIPAAGGNA